MTITTITPGTPGSPGLRRLPAIVGGLAALVSSGCVVITGSDLGRYVEREEHRFATTGKPDVELSTFDGSIDIRPWDRPEVLVVIERRAANKSAAASIEVEARQDGGHVIVNVRRPRVTPFEFGGRSARLIVSVPASADIAARSGDGSIDVERVAGKLALHSGDGSIHGRELNGDVQVKTGDGSITLAGVSGTLDAHTGDGSVTATGSFTALRIRTGDGSVRIHADRGSVTAEDWDLTTGDGTVTLEVPEGFSGELDAHTGDGRVQLDGVTVSDVTGTFNKSRLRGRLGSGGHAVRIRTGDGSILLTRR